MAQIGHGGRRIKSACVQSSPSLAPYPEAEHIRLSAHAVVMTFLHIIGQMDWRLMAQSPKAYGVTIGENEVNTLQVSTCPHAS